MTYCSITPTRPGERKPLFEFCIKQLNEMFIAVNSPVNAYVMNGTCKSSEPDLIPRIRDGIELAKKDGFTHCYIIEDDDFYNVNHFNRDLDFDFFGYSDTTYYNLRNSTYATFNHPRRSSLFTTGFRISALSGFKWPADNKIFLDIALWDFAIKTKKKITLLKGNPCLGVKHSLGLCAGKGHRMILKNKDSNKEYLKDHVSDEAFELYNKISSQWT